MTTNEMISEALTAEPMTVAQLVELTGKSDSTVRKALKELVEAEQATKTDDGYRTPVKVRANHGYARNTKDKADADKRNADVLEAVEANGGSATKVEIAEALNITQRAAQHAIWRLRRAGELQRNGNAYEFGDADKVEDDESEAEAA